jgi:hypothetical protein
MPPVIVALTPAVMVVAVTGIDVKRLATRAATIAVLA